MGTKEWKAMKKRKIFLWQKEPHVKTLQNTLFTVKVLSLTIFSFLIFSSQSNINAWGIVHSSGVERAAPAVEVKRGG